LIARLHAKDASPRIGGLTRIANFFLPNPCDFARKLGTCRRITAAKNLIFVELNHAAMITKLGEQVR